MITVKKKKGSKGQRAKHSTPTRTIGALIGDEEKNGKTGKNRNQEGNEKSVREGKKKGELVSKKRVKKE